MITIKIHLIEIVFIVFITVHNGLACPIMCEGLLIKMKLFSQGEKDGLLNFEHALYDFTLDDIKKRLNNIPGISDDDNIKGNLEMVACGYFRHLLEAAKTNSAILNFDYPEVWCTFRVNEYISTGNIDNNKTMDEQVNHCYGFIVPQMFKKGDYYNNGNNEYRSDGKEFIFETLYENWSVQKFQNIIQQSSSVNDPHEQYPGYYTQIYALGYFNHVVSFTHNEGTNSAAFNSIQDYCNDKGNSLIHY